MKIMLRKHQKNPNLRKIKSNLFETLDRLKLALECEDCYNSMGIDTICPFQSEINEVEIDAILCDSCHQNRADDI